jgi:dienelactone hydrolase
MLSLALVAAAIGVVSVLGIVAAGGASPAGRAAAAPVGTSYAVGVHTETFVDPDRPTKANGTVPKQPDRSLATTIFYPAAGTPGTAPATDAPVESAPAAREDGPFPLIVFAHGFGGSPDAAAGLLRSWAAAGYVVAAPRFPLTNSNTVGGVDAGDFQHQPGDVSFVITSMLQASEEGAGPLAGLVAPHGIGVAGHSLGGITTLGIAAHTCCRDARVKAAVVLSGDPLSFPSGKFDYAKAPPILLVHGTADQAIAYDASVEVFNRAKSPKGLVTITDGDHGAPVSASGPAFASVVRTTTDFFDAYLEGNRPSLERIASDGDPGVTSVRFVSKPGARVTIATQPKQIRALAATVTPRTGLTNGQVVTVKWSGYTPGATINIVQCSSHVPGDAAACDIKAGKILQPNPTGSGSLPLDIVVGPVGTGICDATHPACDVVVNDGGSLDPAASLRIRIKFAP